MSGGSLYPHCTALWNTWFWLGNLDVLLLDMCLMTAKLYNDCTLFLTLYTVVVYLSATFLDWRQSFKEEGTLTCLSHYSVQAQRRSKEHSRSTSAMSGVGDEKSEVSENVDHHASLYSNGFGVSTLHGTCLKCFISFVLRLNFHFMPTVIIQTYLFFECNACFWSFCELFIVLIFVHS